MSTPGIRVSIDGTDITSRLVDPSRKKILVSLTVTDEAGIKSDTCELVVDNREGFPAPPVGALMEVWMGYEPAPAYMGKFRIDEWTKSGPPNVLAVSAKSAELTTAIKETKTRSWHDTTLGAIVQGIAGENGLSSLMDGLASAPVEHIDQQTESDLNFLTRLARRNGAMFKLADGKVIFVKRGSPLKATGAAKSNATVKPVNVASYSLTKSERGQRGSVVCYWHDHDKGKRQKVTAGSGSPVHRDKRIYRTEDEARSAAHGHLGDFRRGKCDSNIEMAGDPSFAAEMFVTLAEFDPDVDGTYNAKSVTHKFDSSGYTTSVSLEFPGQDDADEG